MRRSEHLRAAAWRAALASLGLVVACNLLTGVSDFQKVGCGDGCSDASEVGAVFPDVGSLTDAGDAGDAADAPDAADAFVADVQIDAGPMPDAALLWARWPMPNPPEGGVDANLASYSYDAGVVTDNVTKLAWMQTASTAMTFEQAFDHCASQGLGGFVWRLPTRIELASLIDWTQSPAIDPTAFPDATSGSYWTWSIVPGTDGGAYWSVDFDDGTVTRTNAPATRAVRCVRAQ